MEYGKCQFEGCERRAIAKGYCGSHYAQLQRGNGLSPLRNRKVRLTCTKSDCDNLHYAKGFCRKHYQDLLREKGVKPKRSKASLYEEIKRLSEENQRLKLEVGQLKLNDKQYFDPDHGYDCLCSFCAKWHPLGRKPQQTKP